MPITAKIIDIGGGDSFLVDHLLDLGYQDISASANDQVKQWLGDRATNLIWIIADAATFKLNEKYDI